MTCPRCPSAWCNDTLCGRLLSHEDPGEAHLRRKLGYWQMVEDRMVRAELEAEGWEPAETGFLGLDRRTLVDFEVVRRRGENHRNDASYREISSALAGRSRPAPEPFTRAELERLVEHFAGANDPVARAILEKASARLGLKT